jgi:hypothetical protein
LRIAPVFRPGFSRVGYWGVQKGRQEDGAVVPPGLIGLSDLIPGLKAGAILEDFAFDTLLG